REALEDVAKRHNFSLEVPVRDLSKKARHVLLAGDGDGFAGALPYLRRRLERLLRMSPGEGEEVSDEREGGEAFEDLRPYLSEAVCAECGGARLRRESLAVRVGGHSLADYVQLPVGEARAAFEALEFPERERPVADRLLQEILSRLRFLESVGVGYLSLDRPTTTLSAGGAHRIRLAGQIGARMQGILHVLDAPSRPARTTCPTPTPTSPPASSRPPPASAAPANPRSSTTSSSVPWAAGSTAPRPNRDATARSKARRPSTRSSRSTRAPSAARP